MKKRLLVLLMVFALLLPEMGLAATNGYLVQDMATRSGPGTKYTEELGTMSKDTKITIVSQAEVSGTIWYQVEFRLNQKLHRCYTGQKRVEAMSENIPWDNPDYTEDTLTETAEAYYGPGDSYAKRKKSVAAGTTVRVFAVEGEWAQCDYKEGNKWCRAYIHVDMLQNTQAKAVPVPTAAPVVATEAPRRIMNIVDAAQCLCYDYYGNLVSYKGRGEKFAEMLGLLPVMEYQEGIPCMESKVPVYSGPGDYYWQRYIARNGDVARTGKLDTNLHAFGMENGWVMIRYPSDSNGGYRYGWITPRALNESDVAKIPYAEFAQDTTLVLTRKAEATDDPNRSLEKITTLVEGKEVKGLAFLDGNCRWVYCEFTFNDYGTHIEARGFIPADALRVK